MGNIKATHVTKVLNNTDLSVNSLLVKQFFNLYIDEANFPDKCEREDPEDIMGRIREMPIHPTVEEIEANKPDPFTHLLCLEIEDSGKQRELAAGCIVEYYPISGCTLITYIFVSTKYRGKKVNHHGEEKGLAEILLTDEVLGLPSLIEFFNSTYAKNTVEGDVVKAVFFESNNPLLTDKDSMIPHQRLRFFKKLGAKRIDFQYVQPPIGTGYPPVSNLFLLTFPEFSSTGNMFMPVLTIMQFVLELAKSLDKNQEDGDSKYGENNFNRDIHTLSEINKEIKKDYARHIPIDMSRFIEGEDISPKEYTLLGYPYQEKSNNILQQMFSDLLKNAYPGTDLIYLSEIPRTEEPNFLFKRASITLHVLVDEDYFEVDTYSLTEENGHWVDPKSKKQKGIYNKDIGPEYKKTIPKTELVYCPICHSFETDLFSYHNQFDTPYFTKSFLFDSYVVVRFPSSMQFTSEGRKESMYVKQSYQRTGKYCYERTSKHDFQYVPFHLAISYTYFERSNIRIWNLSFTSSDEFPIDEFAIIKLAKFFTGSQENKSLDDKEGLLLDTIKFAICDYEQAVLVRDKQRIDTLTNDFKSLPEAFFGYSSQIGVIYTHLTDDDNPQGDTPIEHGLYDSMVSYKNLKTGTLQVDLSDGFVDVTAYNNKYSDNWKEYLVDLFNDLYLTIRPNATVESISDDNSKPGQAELRQDAAKMLCGTTLGIFDFDRMGFEEIDDTLTPRPASAKTYSFLTVNRGALTSYHVEQDSVLESSWNTLGASPYLLIPNAVLTHNEYVVLDAGYQLDNLLKYLQSGKTVFRIRPEVFIKSRNKIGDLLNDDYLSNVFHYKTERDLYNYGSNHRGITNALTDAKAKLKQVDTMIDQLKNIRESRYQRTIEILGSIISLTSIFTFLKDYITLYHSTETKDVYARPIILSIFFPLTIIGILVFYRLKSTKTVVSLGPGNYVSRK